MGEYIRLDGQTIKLATCESAYYARYSDLVEWVQAGRVGTVPGNLPPADYLDGSFRFRFPFPDEDHPDEWVRLDRYGADYNRGLGFSVPAELMPDDVDHFPIGLWLPAHGFPPGIGGVQYRVSCPQGPEWDVVPRVEGPLRNVEIVQQRPFDGRLWTVLRCAYCGAMWRIDAEMAGVLAAALADSGTAAGPEMARRVLAGYEEGVLWTG